MDWPDVNMHRDAWDPKPFPWDMEPGEAAHNANEERAARMKEKKKEREEAEAAAAAAAATADAEARAEVDKAQEERINAEVEEYISSIQDEDIGRLKEILKEMYGYIKGKKLVRTGKDDIDKIKDKNKLIQIIKGVYKDKIEYEGGLTDVWGGGGKTRNSKKRKKSRKRNKTKRKKTKKRNKTRKHGKPRIMKGGKRLTKKKKIVLKR